MADDETLRFYAEQAGIYAEHRKHPIGAPLDAFLDSLPPGAHILELGCGNGSDAAHMLARGFDIDPTDGTPELAAIAAQRLQRPVRTLRFKDLAAEADYDGVWAAASLLHVPAEALSAILARIHRALRPGGLFTASYKAGAGAGRDALGRYYNYPDPPVLEADYRAAGAWQALTIETVPGSGYDAQPTEWLWVTARR